MKYGDPRAVPALQGAIPREETEHHRRWVILAVAHLGGFSADEQVEAIVAFATQAAAPEGSEELRKANDGLLEKATLEVLVSIGQTLTDPDHADAEVARALVEKRDALRAKQPMVATILTRILSQWLVPAATEDVLAQIALENADAFVLDSALSMRAKFREQVGPGLRKIVPAGGTPAGIAAILLQDDATVARILRGDDRKAQRAMLACARSVRHPLPVKTVAGLLDVNDIALQTAAARYLESEDSVEARSALLGRTRGRARILGARMGFDPGHNTYPAFDVIEDSLRDLVLGPDGPREVLALLSAGYWGDDGQRIVCIYEDRTEFMIDDGSGRQRYRVLGPEEIEELLAFVSERRVDELPPLNTSVHDGIQYEYMHLRPEGGRRVFMNNPGMAGSEGSTYELLVKAFVDMSESGTYALRHPLTVGIPEARLLMRREKASAQLVWARGDDLRVLVTPPDGGAPAWRSWRDGSLEGPCDEPADVPALAGHIKAPEGYRSMGHLNRFRWQVRVGDAVVIAAVDKERAYGLWRVEAGKVTARLSAGNCGNPLVTPDGRWLIAAKVDGSWAIPNYLVRINLASGREEKLGIPPADRCDPIAYVPAHDRILVIRENENVDQETRAASVASTEFLLLDATTGRTTPVKGEFRPWEQATVRPLQSTGTKHEAWAALPDRRKNSTLLGRYDMKAFVFRPIMTLPGVLCTSMQVWVDEDRGFVYVISNGDLIRVPLEAELPRRQ